MTDGGRQSAFLQTPETPDMQMTDIPFATTDWSSVPSVRYEGTSGLAYWRTVQCGAIRVH